MGKDCGINAHEFSSWHNADSAQAFQYTDFYLEQQLSNPCKYTNTRTSKFKNWSSTTSCSHIEWNQNAITASIVFFATSVVFASPLQGTPPQEYHYVSDGKKTHADSSKPITSKGLLIYTTELASTAAHGTIRSINDGHRFFHHG
jgi:hypothetical protein